MTIAVTGASGQLGQLVLQALLRRRPADSIVALVRAPERATAAGVPARSFDYDQPNTHVAALEGVDTLLLISGSDVGRRVPQHRAVIDAARRAGVRRIAYTSAIHADVSALDIAADHRATEEAIKASGLPFTIARHGWYSENYASAVAGAVANGAVIGSARDGRIASATRADYAEGDAVLLTTEGHAGMTYELAGDHAWTLADLAAEISRQVGREIPYRDLPPSEYEAILVSVGLPGPFARAIVGWDVAAADGALLDESRTLSRLIGRPTTSLAGYVASALGR